MLLLWFPYHFNLVRHSHHGQTTLKQDYLLYQISNLPFQRFCWTTEVFKNKIFLSFPQYFLNLQWGIQPKTKSPNKNVVWRPQHWALKLNENGLMFKLKLPSWILLSGRSKLFAISILIENFLNFWFNTNVYCRNKFSIELYLKLRGRQEVDCGN